MGHLPKALWTSKVLGFASFLMPMRQFLDNEQN